MFSILGSIQLGSWELGSPSGEGAITNHGTFSVPSATSFFCNGQGGLLVGHPDAVLGTIMLGYLMFGNPRPNSILVSSAKSGSVVIASSCSLSLIAHASTSFTWGFSSSAVFLATPHVAFIAASKFAAIFAHNGRVTGHPLIGSVMGASFASTSVPGSTFVVRSKVSVQFFVKNGQGPACYYDNGYIDPNSKILNYVF